ncbi:hypothetical protein BU107_04600 [Staphylococcus xylosus]|uniref:hypothetical protein n=1 Tax=Staphylococcus xylosus TaxID=1288 RepID=UPI000E6969B7|nr:hypothetical protein [Staphylococcus xylosus]RIM89008.1 hypothetical protein BU107_04600 [Staphylococcus xylosus]
MYSVYIKNGVQSLLNSNISATTISEKTNVNLSIVKKLKSNLQTIENTSFDSISKLYDYYLDNQKEIEAQKEVHPVILNQKLPNSVIKFLDEITYSVNQVNFESVSRVSEVYVYDKYTIDNKGNSKSKKSYIKIDESIPVKKSGVVYNYQISIENAIDSKDKIRGIKDLKIIFDRELLEIELKKHKMSGSKIKVHNSKDGSTGIRVVSHGNNKEIYNIESSYFNIDFKEGEHHV